MWLLTSSTDEELGAVVVVETSVTTTLVLGQDVHGDEELPVLGSSAGLGNDHATLDVLTLDTTEKETRVVTGSRLVAGLLESLNVGDLCPDGGGVLADKLDFRILAKDTTLNTTGGDGTTARNGEDILDRHEEGLLKLTDRGGNPLVDGVHELVDLFDTDLRLAVLEGAQSRTEDNRSVVTLETVAGQELTHLHLDELQHLLVLNSIDLVDENDNPLDTNLTGEEQVLTGLGHLTVGSSDDDNGTVHGGGTGDHVLDVIGVTGAVDVSVVAVFGLVLDVGSGDGDTTLALLGRLVNRGVVEEVCEALFGLALGDGSGKGRLAVIDVANGAWGWWACQTQDRTVTYRGKVMTGKWRGVVEQVGPTYRH